MEKRHLPLRLGILACLSGVMAWGLLAAEPLPFGISIQREMGFVVHVSLFGLVALACAVAFPRALWWGASALLVAAAGLEAAQLFIPARKADLADFAMNCLGVLLGLAVFHAGAALISRTGRKKTIKM